jgi:hypothetical protein
MTRFKIIKHSNHRGSHGEVVGQADSSNAVADYCTKTGTHRISGRDRAGRKWSIEIGLDLFEQMQLNNALRDRRHIFACADRRRKQDMPKWEYELLQLIALGLVFAIEAPRGSTPRSVTSSKARPAATGATSCRRLLRW